MMNEFSNKYKSNNWMIILLILEFLINMISGSFNNEIVIIIKGIGKHRFIGENYIQSIKSVYINNTNVNITNNEINLVEYENIIKIEIYLEYVNSLNFLFKNCKNITFIDLSNFNSTSKNGMHGMFEGCTNLESINFSNFDTSNFNNMENLFNGCHNLKSLNLSNFNTSSVVTMNQMFNNCKNLQSLDLSNFNTSNVNKMEKMFCGCENLITLNLSNFDLTQVINMYNIFNDCPNLEMLDLSNSIISINTGLTNFVLTSEKLGYINLTNTSFSEEHLCNNILKNINKSIIIYRDFIDEITNNSIIKSCYHSCREEFRNNYICNITDNIKYNIEITTQNNIKIISDSKISETYPIKILSNAINTLEEIKEKNDLSESILGNNFESLVSKEIYPKKTLDNLIESLFGNDLESLLLNIDNIKYMKRVDNRKYFISTLSNQIDNNSSFIDLGNCSNKLKSQNMINDTEELVIIKIENKIEGINIPIIQYEIYSKNGTQLNLDICKNNNITYFIPVEINGNEIYKYDPESNFYNNRCNKYKTENNTDITLYDRKNEFNDKNLSLCELNCTFRGYNPNTSSVECDCIINPGLNILDINKTDLINKLKSTKTTTNLDVMQCTEIFTSTEDLKSNPGFFLLILILVIFFIVFIIFCIKGYNSLENKIEDVIYKRFKKKENDINKKNNIIEPNKSRKNKSRKNKTQRSTLKNLESNKNKNNIKNQTIRKKNKTLRQNKKNKSENISKMFETDYELNNALYEDALRFDKRSGCDYYSSLLKSKQIFIFTFLNFDDNNSGIIKKYIFFLSFALHYTINALFFNDSNMHQIFKDEGKYNIGYQLPFIFLSTFLSIVILRMILILLVLTDKNIFEIKCQETLQKANILKKTTLRNILIKFTIFFVLNLLILISFWYYLTCWNAVYENTQLYLIKNSLISFAISLIYPFIINIIPVILRQQSLKQKKKKYLYDVSKIAQLL